ncbi:MAG: hypothetical protein ACHQIM_16745 [Sphingobacteriales bacterium]
MGWILIRSPFPVRETGFLSGLYLTWHIGSVNVTDVVAAAAVAAALLDAAVTLFAAIAGVDEASGAACVVDVVAGVGAAVFAAVKTLIYSPLY